MPKAQMKILLLLFLLFFGACSSGGQKEREQLRKLVAEGNYNGALGVLKSSKFYQSEDGKLLFHLEKGTIHHLNGEFLQSVREFEVAKNMVADQIALRVSGKLFQMIANDNYNQYVSPSYELSSIHLLQTLNYFLIYQQGFYEAHSAGEGMDIEKRVLTDSERRSELFKARAELVAWNGLTENLKRDKEGVGIYKDDLMAKLLGAQIHEAIDTVNDRQIALQLYRDAKDVLLKGYGAYDSFNSNAKSFRENYKKLIQSAGDKNPYDVLGDNFRPTTLGNELKDYIDYKILVSTRRTRPADWDKMVKFHRPSKEVVEKAKKTKDLSSNMVFFMAEGLIPEKAPEKHFYGLEAALQSKDPSVSSFVASLGVTFIVVFAADKLGLLPAPQYYSPGKVYVGLSASEALVRGVSISFELPKVLNTKITDDYQIAIKEKGGSKELTQNFILINDVGAIAEESVGAENAARYLRTGLRLAIKHAVAIAASIATYQGIKKGKDENESSAAAAAAFQYFLANQAIKASEKADTRYWATLPRQFRMAEVSLSSGDYELSVSKKREDTTDVLLLKSLDREVHLEAKDNKQLNMFYRL
jgi:hypothetical protein